MKTKEQVEAEFLKDLNELLERYNAEMSADDHFSGYAECGEDIRITVDIPGIYNEDGNVVRETTEINLGKRVGFSL